MEDVAAGGLTLPLEDLDRIEVTPHGLTLLPTPGKGHAPIHLADLADPPALVKHIDSARDVKPKAPHRV